MARYALRNFGWLTVALFAMLVPIVLLQFIAASSARPSAPSDKSAQADLPTIKLPYGTWRASKYDAASDV